MTSLSLPYIKREQKYTALNALLELPWLMLLDSAGDDIRYNRYDILSFRPSVKLSFHNAKTHIKADIPLPPIDQTNPIRCLRELLNYFKPQQICHKETLPFNGGWLGYISYDFGRFLETIPNNTVDDIALPEIQMGLYQWALITDHQKQTTTVYNFGLNNKDWTEICTPFNIIKSNLTQSHSTPNNTLEPNLPTPKPFHLLSNWQSNTSLKDYQKAFERIQNYIHAGDCYQVNYAQRFSAQYSGSALSAYKKLAQTNKAPFSAFMNFDDHQVLSLSPERFIESHHNKVLTQPIKGTRPRSHDPIKDKQLAEALSNSPKDQAENLMIVDLLRNDLSKTADKGSVTVTELFGHYQFESVHHLISTISAKLAPQFDMFDILSTTLPGGSITGAPKIRAMQIIEELEPVKRNLYCGIIGYLDFNGNMDTNICIRTLIAKNNHLYCWGGGGIVADSEVDTEYQETFDKLAKILPILEQIEPSC